MKRSLKSYIKIYFMMIGQDFKAKMAYRADFIVSTIAMLLGNVASILSFWLIFNSVESIEGYSYNEMLLMYGFALMAYSPMQLFFDNLWQVWIHCKDGDFIKYCFKPMNLFFYYIAETFDAKGIGQFVLALGLFVYAYIKLGIPVTFANIALLLVALLGGSIVLVGIMTFACGFSFITLNGATIMIFFNKFKDYARYPMGIYNTFFKIVFSIVMPIGFIAFYPINYLLRPGEGIWYTLLTPVIGIIVFFIGYKFWMHGAVKYAGTGS